MSDKTCVVQFMEYGNYEEVLLTDCVPITDANIQMINQYNTNLALQNSHYPHQAPLQQQQQPAPIPTAIPSHHPQHHQQQQHHQHHPHHSQQQQSHHHQQQQQQRFRGERQMYVPPAQRSTK